MLRIKFKKIFYLKIILNYVCVPGIVNIKNFIKIYMNNNNTNIQYTIVLNRT